MPVLVNLKKCNCAPNCFAATACPKDALYVDRTRNQVTVEAQICGDCPAPCLNFCDRAALKFAPNLLELDIMAREMAGELTAEQAAEERKLVTARLKAETEEKAKAEAEASYLPVKLTQETFVDTLSQSEIPVLVDFWAEWCGPCKQVSPILDELSKTFAGKIKFAKVNVDEEPVIAGQLQIQSIPTLVVFFQGQIADMIVGALPKPQLQARLQQIVEAVTRFQARQNPAQAQPKPTTQNNGEKPPATSAQPKPATRPNLVVSPYNLPPNPPRRPRGK